MWKTSENVIIMASSKNWCAQNGATTWCGERCADLETKASKFCWISFKKKLKKIGRQHGAVKDVRIWSQKASNFGWVLLKKKLEKIGQPRGAVKDVRIWSQRPAIFVGFR